MATTPTPTPVAPITPVLTAISKDWTWLMTHIPLLVVMGGLIFGGVYGVESLIAKHDELQNNKAQADKAVILQVTKQMQDQAAARDAELVQVINTQNTIIASLQTQIAKRDQVTKVQVQKDATLTAKDSAIRLASQTEAGPNEIQAVGDTVVMDLPITHRVVQSLDTLVTVQADYLDAQKELAAETAIAVKTKEDLDAQKILVADKDKVILASDKACNTAIAAAVSKERKSKWKWVLGALGTGIGIGLKLAL